MQRSLKKVSQCRKTERGDPVDFSTSILSENIKKLKGGPFGENSFSKKKSHRAENTLRGKEGKGAD